MSKKDDKRRKGEFNGKKKKKLNIASFLMGSVYLTPVKVQTAPALLEIQFVFNPSP